MKMNEVIGGIVVIVFAIVASALLMALPVYFLWNALMPEIFGLTALNFWQAVGISLLAGCLFSRSSGSTKA